MSGGIDPAMSAQAQASKRRVTQMALNEADMAKKRKVVVEELMMESSAHSMWNMPESDSFLSSTKREVMAEPTDLANNIVTFYIHGTSEHIHPDTIKFHIPVILEQQKIDATWITANTVDNVIVLPGAVLNQFKENLKVTLISPGITENTKLINIKQDNQRYITPHKIQREFDKLYVENELESDMHIVKEQCYDYDFKDDSAAGARKTDPAARYGKRDKKLDIKFADGSIYKKCLNFAKELQTPNTGKMYNISAPLLDDLFRTKMMPDYYGFKVSFHLDRLDEMKKYIESYDKTNDAPPYRFRILNKKKVRCTYDASSLTRSAEQKFNEQFSNNSSVVVSKFPVFIIKRVNLDKGATEALDFQLPATTYLPDQTIVYLTSKADFNHTSVRANYFNNSLQQYTKKIKFNNASGVTPNYQNGTSFIDFEEYIDKEGLYNSYRRYIFGMQNVNMSNSVVNYGVLNGSSKDFYNNQFVTKQKFQAFTTETHAEPIVFDLETSHGKYEPDQRPQRPVNNSLSMNFLFNKPLGKDSVLFVVCQYKGSYILKKMPNGAVVMNFSPIDAAANLM